MFGNGMEPFFVLLLKLWTQESTSSHLRLYTSSETLQGKDVGCKCYQCLHTWPQSDLHP